MPSKTTSSLLFCLETKVIPLKQTLQVFIRLRFEEPTPQSWAYQLKTKQLFKRNGWVFTLIFRYISHKFWSSTESYLPNEVLTQIKTITAGNNIPRHLSIWKFTLWMWICDGNSCLQIVESTHPFALRTNLFNNQTKLK